MMRTVAALVVCLAAVLHAQQPFRTGTDAVVVDVSVRDGGTAVRGLTANDFVLTDNGVRQRIDSVEAGTVPVDVTLVVDVSGHPSGAWTTLRTRAKVTEELRDELAEVAKLLRKDDRIRLLAADTSVQQVFPMTPVTAAPAIDRLEFDGTSSLYDTLTAALLQPVEPSRRHVVIARTKGIDTMSAVTAGGVAAIAQQSDALFHLVLMETSADNDAAIKAFQCQFIGLCLPTRRFWVPHRSRLALGRPRHDLTPDGQALARATDETGGALHKTTGFSEPTLTGTFKKAFQDFRTSYVLRYTLQGVAAPGWHRIDVRVPKSKTYTVRSRRGYLVESPVAAAAPSPPLPTSLERLPDLITAYDRLAFRDVVLALRDAKSPRALIQDFEEGGNPWPANPKIEAAFALELAEAGLFATDGPTRDEGRNLLDRTSRFIRHPLEPDIFERHWLFAALTTLEGAMHASETMRVAAQAMQRFPDEPRFVLSRAIASDQAHSSRVKGVEPREIETNYDAALKFPDTAAEARVRYGYFLYRTNRPTGALQHLAAPEAQTTTDMELRYLRQLFLGHVFMHLQRIDEAVAAYREALRLLPGAQSSRVGLMNALLLKGHRDEAEAFSETVQSGLGRQSDPWSSYWQGQYRFQPQAMARMRELSR